MTANGGLPDSQSLGDRTLGLTVRAAGLGRSEHVGVMAFDLGFAAKLSLSSV
ncbi:hypothetical protein [Streptomyces sp. NPDC006879]|uniref:hypothetical protein n=1 Tax=Streptomyces sp. NPDC006879 TaxID=3364767 RepID=UPI00369CF60F